MASPRLAPFAAIRLDPNSRLPLYQQLYNELREAVLERRLLPGHRLPSSRELSRDLSVARNTVGAVYEQLTAEGYLCGRVGSGTYVAPSIPDQPLLRPETPVDQPVKTVRRTLSSRGAALAEACSIDLSRTLMARPLRPGCPALDEFPHELWSRILGRRRRQLPPGMLGYGDSAGYAPLRKAIAVYLRAARGVTCDWRQVLVISGAQQGLDLCARLLLDPDDEVWMEDPGYRGARGAFVGAGARVVPVPVDQEGLQVSVGEAIAPGARLAYVSPSHQYPLGVTMSLSRRLALLRWAQDRGSWVIEDDYDSEYRYRGRPLASLQGLDTGGSVIYLGTFSKVLYPALRLGYLVAPPDLIEPFIRARTVLDRQPPLTEQVALAEFIDEGHFGRHLRRMRGLYASRQAALVSAASRHLQGFLEAAPDDAGLHLMAWLTADCPDRDFANRLAAVGVEAQPVSAYCDAARLRGGLLLGYAGFSEKAIQAAVRKIATVAEKI